MSTLPKYVAHARGIERAISSVQDVSRELSKHWQTDGEHREEIVREQIRERVPARYIVGSGIIVDGGRVSPQIDILVYDSQKPVFQRTKDGKVFVTPDAVRAIVEVKSTRSGEAQIREALEQVAKSAALCDRKVWSGLFVHAQNRFPDDTVYVNYLEALEATRKAFGVSINCVSAGPSAFVRYWKDSAAEALGECQGAAWHTYFIDRLAPAYFIGNLIGHVARIPDKYAKMWFPIPDPSGKESMRTWYLPVGGEPMRFKAKTGMFPKKPKVGRG
jgi:hypothetical protein